MVVHGVKTDPTRVTTCSILQEMGMAPVESRDAAQRQLDRGELVFLPIDVLCPPMARQLNLRWRMGVRNSGIRWLKSPRRLRPRVRCGWPACHILNISRASERFLKKSTDVRY
ncbi:hypothetical protein AU487_16420 [Lonsdalea populi]|nr:hypothetical protein AU487_16420 [Lonsdalea populi]